MATDLLEPETNVSSFAAHPAGAAIAERIEETRRQVAGVRNTARRLWTLATASVLFGAWTWIDYTLELPWGLRAIGLLGLAFALGVLFVKVLRRRFPEYPLASAAADVENALPEFGQRLRTTVDYLRTDQPAAPAAPALLRALATDTHKLARQADFSTIVSARPTLFAVAALTVLTVIWLGALAANRDWRIATGRTLLLPLHYTTVTVLPTEDQTIRAGESIPVVANITGRPIDTATVRYRPAGSDGPWKSLPLLPPAETKDEDNDNNKEAADESEAAPLVGKVAATLVNCRQDFEFQVLAGPSELPLVHVRVLQPLTIAGFHANATPPSYTKQAPQAFEDWSFKVLEGSRVKFDVELNRAAASAKLTPIADGKADAAAEAVELTKEGKHLLGDLPDLRKSTKWELTARTGDGIDLKPQRLSIRVQADGRAKIRFLEPDEQLEVIATAEVPFVIEGGDDVSLLRVGIAAQVGNGPMKTIWEQTIDGGTTDTIRGEALLALEDHKVAYPDSVTYHAFADDQYFDDIRRTTTPLRFIDIRPFKLSFQMLDTGGT